MLDGKTIIVTGASSGIGAATAKLVAEQGASVISVDIVASTNPVGQFFQADLASQASESSGWNERYHCTRSIGGRCGGGSRRRRSTSESQFPDASQPA